MRTSRGKLCQFLLFIFLMGIMATSCNHGKENEASSIKLSPDFPRVSYTLNVTSPGWYYLSMQITGKTEWNSKSCPSSVLDIYSDQTWLGSIVLWDRAFNYKLFIGKLDSGTFPVSLVFSEQKSPCKHHVVLNKIRLERITGISENCLKHYPYLLGYTASSLRFDEEKYPYNSLSDFPMFWVCQESKEKITYILYYTNEDGGTGLVPAYLMYSWGRTADIENAFTVNLTTGKMFKRDNEEEDTEFEGSLYNDHPLLQVAPQDHGLVTEGKIEDKSWQLLFAPPIYSEALLTREDALDSHPWSYKLMEWEMEREGKITTEEDTLHDQADFLAPLNYYLYLNLFIDTSTKIAMRVKLKNGDIATNDSSSLAWSFSGWKRVVLKLPEPVEDADIEEISLLNLGDKPATVEINKLFYLSDDFSTLNYLIHDYSNPFTAEIQPGEEVRVK